MAKKTYQRQSKSKSLGQTLNGILIGLILGAIIIAALLWFLNKQKMPTEPVKASNPVVTTEIMVPNQTESPESGQSGASDIPTTLPEGGVGVGEASSTVTTGEQDKNERPVTPSIPSVKPDGGNKPYVIEKKPEHKPAETVKKPTDSKPANTGNKPSTKPTPEQILEHGSVEKARAANSNKAEQSHKADKPAKKETEAAATGRSVKIQAGSYANSEQAEAQRAKLALLGISAHVESAQVNGKTVHRVRTAKLNEGKAAQVRKQLSNNGIDAIAVGAN